MKKRLWSRICGRKINFVERGHDQGALPVC